MYLKDLPLVTVVTVTYNSSKYVRDAIESVLNQDYPNIEYLVLDDCSTDDTWDIICEYEDNRIRKIRNKKNIGEYPNRNQAIRLANGEYLLFIDGDDVIFSHGVSFFVKQLSQFPSAAMAIQKGYVNNVLYPALMKTEQTIKNYFFGKNGLLNSSFASSFFRTGILRSLGGLSEKWICGDTDLHLRIAFKYDVLFVAGWVTWPRETPGQASSKLENGTGALETYKIVTTLLQEKLIVNEELKKDIETKLKHSLSRTMVGLLQKGKAKSFFKLKNESGFGILQISKYYFQASSVRDPLEGYTPSAPFKFGF